MSHALVTPIGPTPSGVEQYRVVALSLDRVELRCVACPESTRLGEVVRLDDSGRVISPAGIALEAGRARIEGEDIVVRLPIAYLAVVVHASPAFDPPYPRYGEHRGTYAFPLSDEWMAWNAQNAKSMTQAEFARFIEDRLVDVADPSTILEGGGAADWARRLGNIAFATPSQLLELSRGLAAKVTSHVRGSKDLASGATEVMFASEVTDPNGAALPVPGAFLLAIPVFRRGDLYPLPVRLRHRIKETITWSYELARVDQVFEHAFAEAVSLVGERTAAPVLRGTPEV